MTSADVLALCKLKDDSIILLKQAIAKLNLSARSYFKVIKVAQTIADFEGVESVESRFIAEALQYRVKED